MLLSRFSSSRLFRSVAHKKPLLGATSIVARNISTSNFGDIDKFLSPNYQPHGKITKVSNKVEYYQAGDPYGTDNAVIIISDIYGWDSGRVRNIADYFGANDYFSAIPNLSSVAFNGEGRGIII